MQVADTQRLLQEAVRLHQSGALAECELLYRQVLDQDPRQADAAHLLGMLKQQQGGLDEAIAFFDRSVALDPNIPAFQNSRAVTLKALGRTDEAVAAYDAAIAIDPADADIQFNRGLALSQLGRLGDAVAAFDKALGLAPDFAPAWNNRGLALLNLGLTEQALCSFDAALEHAADASEIHNNRGLILQELGRLEEAVAAFDSALRLQPDSAAARYNCGDALAEMGRLEQALAAFDQALALEPDLADAHCGRGVAMLKQGHAADALAAFDRCLELLPGNVRALAYRPFALREIGHDEEAAELIDLTGFPVAFRPPAPNHYDNLNDFLTSLQTYVLNDPTLTWERYGKTTRGGSQTARLVESDDGAFSDFVGLLRSTIDKFLSPALISENHPHFFRMPHDYQLSIWGTVLESSGWQLAHIHPGGWMSGVYYVAVPDVVRDGDPDQAGWFEIGRAGDDIPLTHEPEFKTIKPEPGTLLMFPSYYFHRTVPFDSAEKRISIAFDVEPISFTKN